VCWQAGCGRVGARPRLSWRGPSLRSSPCWGWPCRRAANTPPDPAGPAMRGCRGLCKRAPCGGHALKCRLIHCLSAVMPAVTNIPAYLFVSLDDLPDLRERILAQILAQDLKGTVLLAPEGINLFLAGGAAGIEAFLGWLRTDARFASLQAKYSYSDTVPFRRVKVRIKRGIIRMNHPAIRPEAGRAPAVDAPTLARWLAQGQDDAGREVVMLDTRNDFEVDAGTFARVID